jgi:membrane-associated protease RseP (regulator of RpoE activity)
VAYAFGIFLFAFGILLAVCLHEAGHMATAKFFGMRVTRYFVGFGPTLWSFKRGDTEYGVKALPFGGFVKIVGMTPGEDEIDETTGKRGADDPKAMWRFPVWKRTIVMSAGSITHFILAVVILWIMFVFVGIPDVSKLDQGPARVADTAACVSSTYAYDPATKAQKPCDPSTDPKSPASQIGLQPGDVVTALNGVATPTSASMRDQLRSLGGKDVAITVQRGKESFTKTAHIPDVLHVKSNVLKTADQITDSDLERGGMLGISIDIRTNDLPIIRYGPVDGIGQTGKMIGTMVDRTFASLKQIPSRVPNLIGAIAGHPRDPNTPVSVVGASRIGGELFQVGDWTSMLLLFATLNLFFGIFNLFPLLPMDGGHIAISWFERVRSWFAAKRGRPDPGRVDYLKLAPLTMGVIGILGVFVLLTVTADIVNPISIK